MIASYFSNVQSSNHMLSILMYSFNLEIKYAATMSGTNEIDARTELVVKSI